MYSDFEEMAKECDRISDIFQGEEVVITTAADINIVANIGGRKPLRQYGKSLVAGASSSPPNVETAIAPIEGSANGIVIIDGSIPHPLLGILTDSIKLTIRDGKTAAVDGKGEAKILKTILKDLADDNAYFLGEIGIGLNPLTTLCGRMLEDEGAIGTAHFGFGAIHRLAVQ